MHLGTWGNGSVVKRICHAYVRLDPKNSKVRLLILSQQLGSRDRIHRAGWLAKPANSQTGKN